MSLKSTSIRPEDDAFNIQLGQLLSHISIGGSHSISLSPMDKSSLSKMDYAKQVTFANNTEVEILDLFPPMNNTALSYNFSLLSS